MQWLGGCQRVVNWNLSRHCLKNFLSQNNFGKSSRNRRWTANRTIPIKLARAYHSIAGISLRLCGGKRLWVGCSFQMYLGIVDHTQRFSSRFIFFCQRVQSEYPSKKVERKLLWGDNSSFRIVGDIYVYSLPVWRQNCKKYISTRLERISHFSEMPRFQWNLGRWGKRLKRLQAIIGMVITAKESIFKT